MDGFFLGTESGARTLGRESEERIWKHGFLGSGFEAWKLETEYGAKLKWFVFLRCGFVVGMW